VVPVVLLVQAVQAVPVALAAAQPPAWQPGPVEPVVLAVQPATAATAERPRRARPQELAVQLVTAATAEPVVPAMVVRSAPV
jgi:hypothetical protein